MKAESPLLALSSPLGERLPQRLHLGTAEHARRRRRVREGGADTLSFPSRTPDGLDHTRWVPAKVLPAQIFFKGTAQVDGGAGVANSGSFELRRQNTASRATFER